MTFLELLTELNNLDEHPSLEAKGCDSGKLGDSFFETVCSFCNEPDLGGGRLILGVRRDEVDLFGGYEVIGIDNPDKIQADIATGCATIFNLPVRPRTQVETHNGRAVIVVEVNELAPAQKPLFFKKHGLPRGAWRRIGSTDQRCTEEDLIIFYGNRQTDSYDLTILPHATLDDLDPEAITHYRRLRKKVNEGAEKLSWTDNALLQALNAIRRDGDIWRPTMTGLLLFGTRMALRRDLPAVRLDYIRVPGKEWVSDPDQRFTTTVDMRGPLLQLVDRAQAAVMDDLPKGFELKEGEIQAETPTLPARVLREAIVNALMHRSYREHQPTQIIRYSNRIEIRNVGFSLKNEDQLGAPGSALRNPHLAAVFHETNTAETKGSGIRVMREQMRKHKFSLPTFESNRAENFFASRLLLHQFLSESDLRWLAQIGDKLSESQRTALIFLREQGAIDNRTLRQLTGDDVLTASQDLRRLRDLKIIEQKGKGSATYYIPGSQFPRVLETKEKPVKHGTLESEHMSLGTEHMPLDTEHMPLDSEHMSLGNEPTAFETELGERVQALGKRPGEKIRPLILEFCALRPRTAREIAEFFQRDDALRLKRDHLSPLIESGALDYLYRDMIRHPHQAYRAVMPAETDEA